MAQNPPIVIDNGTGYTKMGYAGNLTPSYVIPTAVASDDKVVSGGRDKLDDLDFYIGDEVRVWGHSCRLTVAASRRPPWPIFFFSHSRHWDVTSPGPPLWSPRSVLCPVGGVVALYCH